MKKPTGSIILHIPHSSTFIPFREGFVLADEEITKEIGKLTDWYTDDLFDSVPAIKIVTPFSRVFCDVERFTNDELEVMAKYGMGVLYEKTDDGRQLRIIQGELREKIIKNFYCQHHHKFQKAVQEELESAGRVLIVDCHSFPDIPMIRDLVQTTPRPDINIGVEGYHTPEDLTRLSLKYFEAKGYHVLINKPYSGSIVPLQYYLTNRNVMSIMVEINRKLYLEEESNSENRNYGIIKDHIAGFLELVRSEYLNG